MGFWQRLEKPIVGLAPMDGVTDYPMRAITAEYGRPDLLYTEFVNVEYAVKKPEKILPRFLYDDFQRPIIAQLSGSDPELFYRLAIVVCFLAFDGIDLNLGCPAKSVVSRGAGAGLIGQFNQVEAIISALCRASADWQKQPQLSRWLSQKNLMATAEKIKRSRKDNLPELSVKTRICRADLAKEWFSFLASLPIQAVAVHGRRADRGNSGPVDWSALKQAGEIMQEKGKIFLVNGNLSDRAETEKVCLENGFDGGLIGQSSRGNPWVFKNVQPTKRMRLLAALKHARIFVDTFGKEDFIKMRKHFAWYPRCFSQAKKLKTQLLQVNNLIQAEEIILAALKNNHS